VGPEVGVEEEVTAGTVMLVGQLTVTGMVAANLALEKVEMAALAEWVGSADRLSTAGLVST